MATKQLKCIGGIADGQTHSIVEGEDYLEFPELEIAENRPYCLPNHKFKKQLYNVRILYLSDNGTVNFLVPVDMSTTDAMNLLIKEYTGESKQT